METKLKCLIYKGSCDGIVEIIQNPYDDTIACRIGEFGFYFIGSEYENLTPYEVYETFTKEELTEMILSAMIELDKTEIEYYEMFLKEKLT